MGKLSHSLQSVQLSEGRQDSRRSEYDIKEKVERNIILHLLKKYSDSEIIIRNDPFCYIENPDLDVDLEFLRIVFGRFKEISVGAFGFHVSYYIG